MLEQWKVKTNIDYKEVIRKGTVGCIVTFLSGFFFGKENMMIAFVIVLGANNYERQNLHVKPIAKIAKLLLLDVGIVLVAFIASRSVGWGIIINLLAVFLIVYLLVSPYDQLTYKTFMMLYVFAQYNGITLAELPDRLGMIVFAMGISLVSSFLGQRKKQEIFDSNIRMAWEAIALQIRGIASNQRDAQLEETSRRALNEVAYTIYRTGYKKYFTTQQGRVQFYFYLLFSHMQFLVERMDHGFHNGEISLAEVKAWIVLGDTLEAYFQKQVNRQQVMELLQSYKEKGTSKQSVLQQDMQQAVEVLYDTFLEVAALEGGNGNKVYKEWERTNLRQLYDEVAYNNLLDNMRMNFAVRMALVLTVVLVVAHYLDFYKMIWALIPIMSTTRPCYEDTLNKRKERLQSNLLACLIIGVLLNIAKSELVLFLLTLVGFYGVYAFKDYYRMSFFLTVISMCLSSVGITINSLIFYRLMYLLIGITIVQIIAHIRPYGIKDSMDEMVKKLDSLNEKMEREAIKSLDQKENAHLIRETIIHAAMLMQHLTLQNKVCKEEQVAKIISENTLFMTELGYQLLIEEH